jgi:hypothetical protein
VSEIIGQPKGLRWYSDAKLYKICKHTKTGKTRRKHTSTRNIRKGGPGEEDMDHP